ncbi:hypothetical protein CDV55_106624 [Aspergillus turcosus]|uniref:Small EDRK-rich factor-like N-terminal domain-containing protein n=1 Tax=Aspergillus turcosus TaxID=1245748 RepID=A0A229XAK0_9EURO|nr:hypothetical protein CDV55_106624 [Aspergillus turcosus]RLM01192.1 hypothetical protein CFD26_106748 [Aspergillus turcosus]
MTRGNQRDRDREKNLKAKAKQKGGNPLSGTEFQRAKENNAAIMRAKQAAGQPKQQQGKRSNDSIMEFVSNIFTGNSDPQSRCFPVTIINPSAVVLRFGA